MLQFEEIQILLNVTEFPACIFLINGVHVLFKNWPYGFLNNFYSFQYFSTKIHAAAYESTISSFNQIYGTVMKKSWFDWKISCLFNTYQPFLIHSFPKNYNNSQQCFMETYEDLKRHSEKRHKRFHIYTTTQHEVILVLREKPKSYFNGVSVFFFTFF